MRTIELALACAIALAGCSGETDVQAGGHTNWLTCDALADCVTNPAAVACTGGYCVDDKGNRLPAGTGTRDGGVRRDGGGQSGSGGASAGGQSGNGGRSAGGSSGAATGGSTSGGTANGGAGGTCSGVPAGCGEEGSPCCDPFPCDGPNFCHGSLSCCGSACRTSCADGGGIRVPTCPGPMTERCASERCVTGGLCLECPTGQVCLEVQLSCGPAGGTTAQCIPDPCATAVTLDCSCAQSVCDSIGTSFGALACNAYTKDNFLVGPNRNPFLACSGGGVCASPDTLIETPRGEVPIAQLRPGDLVYSIHDNGIVSVPIAAVSSTPVTNHHVFRIEVEGGRAIEVSGPHPVLDGRRLDALSVGERLDGHAITGIERIPYRHGFTHDILPASDTGAYRSGGVWLGSTLRHAPSREDSARPLR
jgi:hypothetical protein